MDNPPPPQKKEKYCIYINILVFTACYFLGITYFLKPKQGKLNFLNKKKENWDKTRIMLKRDWKNVRFYIVTDTK